MWGYESGILPSLGHLSRFQHKVLKWTELPTFAWKNFGPAPEIGTLRRAASKFEGEIFSPSSSGVGTESHSVDVNMGIRFLALLRVSLTNSILSLPPCLTTNNAVISRMNVLQPF